MSPEMIEDSMRLDLYPHQNDGQTDVFICLCLENTMFSIYTKRLFKAIFSGYFCNINICIDWF